MWYVRVQAVRLIDASSVVRSLAHSPPALTDWCVRVSLRLASAAVRVGKQRRLRWRRPGSRASA